MSYFTGVAHLPLVNFLGEEWDNRVYIQLPTFMAASLFSSFSV